MRANIARAAGRNLQFRGLSRQRRRQRRAADDRARSDDRGDDDDARLLALVAAVRGAAQHRAFDRGRLLLCRRSNTSSPTCPPTPAVWRRSEFVIPETTLLGVSAPKPVGGYTETILRVIGVVFGAFAKAAPERANAAPVRHHQRALARRLARRTARAGSCSRSSAAASAAIPEGDGFNHGNNPISMATIPPAEILEASYPVMFTRWALRPDSAGAGLHRGGLGAIYEIEALARRAAPKCSCSASAEAFRRSASMAASRRRSTASSGRRRTASARRRSPRRSPT